MMKITQAIVLFVGVNLLGPTADALSETSLKALRDDLMKQISHSSLNKKDLGLIVVSEEGDEEVPVMELNSATRMVPASLSKIVTAGAVLHYLPANFQFKTQLLASDPVQEGVLKGSLYLKGGGDPSFTSETMWFLVNEFYRNDVKEVAGDIVVDDTRFDDERYDESRESTRVDRAYDAPLGAMSFNWNSVNVYVRPGGRVGEPAIVKADPINSYITVLNHTKTGKVGSAKTIAVSRVAGKDGDQIQVTGSLAMGADEAVIYKSITQPALWSGTNLIEFLRQRGIAVKGRVRRGITPASARIVAMAPSKPISYVVADMAKFSNNYVAEMLTKNLAFEGGSEPGTMKAGVDKIRQFLDEIGLNRSQYTFNNPSGLTRENEMSPRDMRRVLNYLRRQFTIYPEFLAALPVAGVDGTLKSRMKSNGAQWVRAKTGLLTGVVGLAGFAARPDGANFSFVFLYNGGADGASVRKLFDEMAGRLTK